MTEQNKLNSPSIWETEELDFSEAIQDDNELRSNDKRGRYYWTVVTNVINNEQASVTLYADEVYVADNGTLRFQKEIKTGKMLPEWKFNNELNGDDAKWVIADKGQEETTYIDVVCFAPGQWLYYYLAKEDDDFPYAVNEWEWENVDEQL